jgi:outer membrane murein-binding lipoprotein Lpp
MRNHKMIVPAILLGSLVLGAVVYGSKVFAEDTDATDHRAEQVQALAQKLGVDQSKVQTAMDEIRAERQKARQEEISTKLDQAVKDGVITVEQKQKIVDKFAEVKEKRGEKRSELQQWFKDNGIDSGKIHSYIGFGDGSGKGGRGPRD